MVNARVGRCRIDELADLTAKLDAEFVFSRGRTMSLAVRYPGVLDAANLDNLLVARRDNAIVAAVALKPFAVEGERAIRGAMVGLVWTDSTARGGGLASALLDEARAHTASLDVLVLWTSIPAFYARLGWRPHDRGLFGVVDGAAPARAADGTAAGDVAMAARTTGDLVRARYLPERTRRSAGSWTAVPLPAVRVDFLVDGDAYAAVGAAGDAAYVYELVGDRARFTSLWSRISASAPRVYVNDVAGSASAAFFAERGVALSPQSLAMILPQRRDVDVSIPYLDRI